MKAKKTVILVVLRLCVTASRSGDAQRFARGCTELSAGVDSRTSQDVGWDDVDGQPQTRPRKGGSGYRVRLFLWPV